MCPVPSFALGAWLDMTGTLAPSQRGEMTLWATGVCVVQEPTRPLEMLPSHGRVPPEQRFVTHPEQVALLRRRSTLLRSLRQSLWTESFEETETPILHRFASGAAAQPSTTYSRASEAELSLRIAPEPHLIRLMAAGFPRIFEVARSFRNEGFSARHHPEFTLLEVYEAGASLSRSITHCAELFTSSFAALGLNPSVVSFRGNILNFSSPRIVDLRVLVEEQTACQSVDDCVSFLLEQGVTPPLEPLEAWFAVFEHAVEERLIQPTFVAGYPASVSPLALSLDNTWAERFELFAGGMELANGFEQNRDSAIQEERFRSQALRRNSDDIMPSDEEYLFAMGWGLPPLSGFGIGTDRLAMMALQVEHIRQAILFPM